MVPEGGAYRHFTEDPAPFRFKPLHPRSRASYDVRNMLRGGPLWHIGLLAGTALLFYSSWRGTQIEKERSKALWPLLMLVGLILALLSMLLIAVPEFFTAAD